MSKFHIEISDEQTLDNAGIRVTAVRLLIWKTIKQNLPDAFSTSDLETLLPTVDRSTLFRTIHTFVGAALLHEIDDGSGMQKYCVCTCDDHKHHRGHVHLTCTKCHRTFCLTNVAIPSVPLPTGFAVEKSAYVVKGICSDCNVK